MAIVLLVFTIFLQGTKGPNKYRRRPVRQRTWNRFSPDGGLPLERLLV